MSAAPRVTLLYEDSRSQLRDPGLHRLIAATVWDRLKGVEAPPARYELERRLGHRCMKGVDRVLAVIGADLEDIAQGGQHVAAVVDEDVIRDKLGLAPSATVADVERAICARVPVALRDRFGVFVIERNTESVLRAGSDCASHTQAERPDEGLLERALRKDLLARDQLLSRWAKAEAWRVRDCMAKKIPALGALVDWLLPRVCARGAATQHGPAQPGA